MSKFPIIIRDLHKEPKYDDGYTMRFERLEDYVAGIQNGKTYFSNKKFVADRNYTGEVLTGLRDQTCDETSHIIEGDDYDVEVTHFTIVFRHEKVLPK